MPQHWAPGLLIYGPPPLRRGNGGEPRAEGPHMSAAVGTARRIAGTDFLAAERGPAAASAVAVATAWRVFAAQPLQVACARRFVAGVLSGLRAADDVVLCVSELASNSVLHSSSREPGGHFVVRALVNGPAGSAPRSRTGAGPGRARPGMTKSTAAACSSSAAWPPAGASPAATPAASPGSNSTPPDSATLRQQPADGGTDST